MTVYTDHHDYVRELLGAYALDAVDDNERREIELHLEECPRCRQEVDAFREIAAALGNAIEPPPAELWDRIAAALPAGPRQRPVLHLLEAVDDPSGSTAPAFSASTEPVTAPVTGPAEPMGVILAGPRHWKRAWTVAVGASVAAVAAVVVLGLSLANADHQLTQSRAALGSPSSAVEQALHVKGHKVVQLQSPSGQELAEVVLVPGGRGYMLAKNMPALTGDRTYQLWAIDAGTPISLGLLGSHPTAAAFTIGSASPSALAVSVEPSGGSVSPTRPIASGVLGAV